MSKTCPLLCLVTVVALVAVPLGVLWPGVTGPFLFDDFITIGRLEVSGCVEDFPSFINYVLGGHNALGRPLAYVSFLLQDYCWPTSAQPFKEFNVLWHALNGLLVFWLLLLMFSRAAGAQTRLVILGAFLGAIWWVTNMIHQESIFLTVQRMTLMSSTCVLIGLLGYVKSSLGEYWGWFVKAAWVGVFTVLGVLFKEQAILLPLFVLVVDYTVLQPVSGGMTHIGRKLFRFSMMAPLLVLLIYLTFFRVGSITESYLARDFGLLERLLTEARILFDYIRIMLFPGLRGIGIYHDDIVLSTGLLTPLSTLFSVFGWLALGLFAFVYRTRARWAALGILFFIGGHLLESTVLPLELYYQHRNYIPSLGLVFLVTQLFVASSVLPMLKKSVLALVVGLLLIAMVLGRVQAGFWGDFSKLASSWVKEQPDSPRIVRQAAKVLWDEGSKLEALGLMLQADEKFSGSISGRLSYAVLVCNPRAKQYLGEITDEAPSAMYSNAFRNESLNLFSQAKNCEYLEIAEYRAFIQALLNNPKARVKAVNRRWMYMAIAQSYAYEKNLNQAMKWQDKAYEARPDPYIAYTQALWLITAGLYEDALEYARKADSTCRPLKYICLKGNEDTRRLVQMLEKEVSDDAEFERGDSGEE